jgi:hypothetical protein
LSDLIVFGADLILAIESLKPADREMTTGHVLEVLDECIIYRRTAKGSNDWKRLRGYLLRHNQSKARRDLSDELKENGRSLLDYTALRNEPSGLGYGLGEHPSNRKISALGCVHGSGASPERENLNTGENRRRVGQILPLALRYVGD